MFCFFTYSLWLLVWSTACSALNQTSTGPPSKQLAETVSHLNPCKLKLPEKPKFNVTTHRISEYKCIELQWHLEQLKEQRRYKNCLKNITNTITGIFKVPAILGGRPAIPGEFPHMAALGWRTKDGGWKFLCGSTLISDKFLLTAAHCSKVPHNNTSLIKGEPEIVKFGINLQEETTPKFKILQILVYPDYTSPKLYYDIALVELEKKISFTDTMYPACLWPHSDPCAIGNKALVTGWGYVDLEHHPATTLQVLEVNIVNSVKCDELWKGFYNRNFDGVRSSQICAGVLEGGADTCQGDSGGPLQVKMEINANLSYIIGVTSMGNKCGFRGSPGIYTRVSSFLDWIESVVWPGEKAVK